MVKKEEASSEGARSGCGMVRLRAKVRRWPDRIDGPASSGRSAMAGVVEWVKR